MEGKSGDGVTIGGKFVRFEDFAGAEESGNSEEPTAAELLEIEAEMAEEAYIEKGGGGGGKKKKRQGDKTLAEVRRVTIENSKMNSAEWEARHPEGKGEETGFQEVVVRILREDDEKVGLPGLRSYGEWALGVLMNRKGLLSNECQVEAVKKAKGPGGQNMQKNASTARVWHLPTGMYLEESGGKRSFDKSRELAMQRMSRLVGEHERQLVEMVGDGDEKTLRENLAMVLEIAAVEVLGIESKKADDLEKLCGVLGRRDQDKK